MSAHPGWMYPLVVVFLLSPARGGAMPKACLDRDGDVLPAGAIDRLGTARLRHGKKVNAIAFSPSGKMLASGSEDGSIGLWRVPDGKLLRKLPITDVLTWVNFLAFSRDGKVLAGGTSGCGRIHFWDTASGKLLRKMDLRSSAGMLSFALAPDGKSVAAGFDDYFLGCWDAQTGKLLRQYSKRIISCSLAYSADGKMLMSGDGDRNVRVWDADGLRRLGDHPDPAPVYHPCVIALSPDGKTFAHAIHDHLEIRDAKTGVRRHELPGHACKILCLAFSADGKMLASADGWRTGGQTSIRWWDVRSGRLRHAITDLDGYDVLSVAFSPDGKILAAGGNRNTIRLWDTASGKALFPSHGHHCTPRTLAYSPDGRLLASADDDGMILLWDLCAKSPPRRLRGCRGWVASLAFSPDGRLLASAGTDGQIRLWSSASGAVVRQWKAHSKIASAILFAPDGRTLFSGGDSMSQGEPIRQWDVASGKEVGRLEGHQSWICYLAWSIPGKVLFSESCDRTIRSWDVRARREIRRWEKGTDYWVSIAVSPDGLHLIGQSHGDPMEVWDLSAKREPSRTTKHHAIDHLLFSPDGRTLVLGNKQTGKLTLWEMLSEKPRGELTGHRGAISCLAFSPDGKHLATASEDTSILIWDMRRSPSEDVSAPLQNGELAKLWRQLGERDAPLAYRAVLRLAAHPAETLSYLRKHLKASAPFDPRRVRRCIDELDSEQFTVRERAQRELEEITESAEPLLRQTLTEKPTLEVRLRIKNILSRPPLYDDNAPTDRLRELRAVEVLERIGNAESARLLAALAAGAPTARLTREAARGFARSRKRLSAAVPRPASPPPSAARCSTSE